MAAVCGTWGRRWLLAGTLLLGVAGMLAPADSFAALSGPVQSLMSITLPLLGVLLVADLRRSPGPLAPTLLAAVLAAVAVGLFGVLLCVLVTGDSWRDSPTVVLGSVLVQVLAQLVGTGMGLLLRSAWVAYLATFLPLAVWFALPGAAREWLTPYETARHLLAGHMTTVSWLQWLTVFLLWAVILNAVGAVRSRTGTRLETARERRPHRT